jgi:hypothetical protein
MGACVTKLREKKEKISHKEAVFVWRSEKNRSEERSFWRPSSLNPRETGLESSLTHLARWELVSSSSRKQIKYFTPEMFCGVKLLQ